MRILFANDDGMHAPGLDVLERIGRQENYQDADGGVRVPAALKPYMGGLERIAR